MSSAAVQYPYRVSDPAEGAASLAPYLPLSLSLGSNRVSLMGLVESGAAIRVLPYDVGLQLGAVWEQQGTQVQLTGNLSAAEARGLVVIADVGDFSPVKPVLAWTQARTVPLILGQVIFFWDSMSAFFGPARFSRSNSNRDYSHRV